MVQQWTIDARVAVKWFCPDKPGETDSETALLLLGRAVAGEVEFLQPPHWVAEVAGVLVRHAPATAEANVQDMLLFDFCETVSHRDVYRRAIILSQTLGHHLFDTLYHAVALEAGGIFITADERYHAKAAGLGAITLLKDFPLP